MWRCSRDSSRTPVQWDASAHGGFTTGEPWFYVNPNYPIINVAQQEQDPDSILNFYRKAIELRKSLPCVRYGDYREYEKDSDSLYMYTRQDSRQRLMVVCSFSNEFVKFKMPRLYHLDDAEMVLQNYADSDPMCRTLKPWECRVYLWK